MLIDGEKYACEACVRGHRVSNCNHYERPLTHINKKGRPVSQCPHCRGLRKARSSHVKCECGDKPQGKTDSSKLEIVDVKQEQIKCHCTHGQRCTCAAKRDHPLDTVLESEVPSLTRSRSHTDARKPRLATNYSEPLMPVFANGHHKPIHRSNHSGSDFGAPYKIPRPHSIHGHSLMAKRSMTDMPSPRARNGLPEYLIDFSALSAQEERMVRSEHGSPGLMPTSRGDILNQLPQLDLSYGGALNTDVTSSPHPDEYQCVTPYNTFESYFPNQEEQQPPLSAALSAEPVDWSAMGLPFNSGAFQSCYSQPPSYASFDQDAGFDVQAAPTSHPGLTTDSSSGDVSESEDYIASTQSPAISHRHPYNTMEDQPLGAYHLSTDSLRRSMTPPPMLSGVSNLSMEPFLHSQASSPLPYEDYGSTPIDHGGFPHHAFTIHDAQKIAHPTVKSENLRATPPPMRPTSDPLWSGPYSADSPNYSNIPTSNPQETFPSPIWASS